MLLQNHLCFCQTRLSEAGVDNPQLDTRLLFAHALDCDRTTLLTQNDRQLSADEINAIDKLIMRRAAREPVSRILGLREFWGMPFGLNEATLEPRPDSETLIETALRRAQAAPKKILDLGTGTGCLLLALLSEWEKATGFGIDKATRALEQAKLNASRLDLDTRAIFQQGDWLATVTGTFDMIVSNPPYIKSTDLNALQPEVQLFDPTAALDGGADGLAPYRIIIPPLLTHLNKNASVFFEVGHGQANDVAAMLHDAKFNDIEITRDLGGIDRVVSGLWPGT